MEKYKGLDTDDRQWLSLWEQKPEKYAAKARKYFESRLVDLQKIADGGFKYRGPGETEQIKKGIKSIKDILEV